MKRVLAAKPDDLNLISWKERTHGPTQCIQHTHHIHTYPHIAIVTKRKYVCTYKLYVRIYSYIYSPGCPRTHCLDQTDLKLGDASASASGVLTSKVRGATHSLKKKCFFKTSKKNDLALNISSCQD